MKNLAITQKLALLLATSTLSLTMNGCSKNLPNNSEVDVINTSCSCNTDLPNDSRIDVLDNEKVFESIKNFNSGFFSDLQFLNTFYSLDSKITCVFEPQYLWYYDKENRGIDVSENSGWVIPLIREDGYKTLVDAKYPNHIIIENYVELSEPYYLWYCDDHTNKKASGFVVDIKKDINSNKKDMVLASDFNQVLIKDYSHKSNPMYLFNKYKDGQPVLDNGYKVAIQIGREDGRYLVDAFDFTKIYYTDTYWISLVTRKDEILVEYPHPDAECRNGSISVCIKNKDLKAKKSDILIKNIQDWEEEKSYSKK